MLNTKNRLPSLKEILLFIAFVILYVTYEAIVSEDTLYPILLDADHSLWKNFYVWSILTGIIIFGCMFAAVPERIMKWLTKPRLGQKTHPLLDCYPLILIVPAVIILFISGDVLAAIFCKINQVHVTSPIVTVEAKITDKESHQREGRRKEFYHVYFNLFNKNMTISDKYLYQSLNQNEPIYVKIRKGHLGKYFAFELDVKKNNSIKKYSLSGDLFCDFLNC